MLIRFATIINVIKPTQWLVKLFGFSEKIQPLNTYGIRYNPPANSQVITFKFLGRGNQLLGIADIPSKNFGSLQVGELAIGNLETGSNITFKANKSIVIEANNSTITIDALGNVVINSAGSIQLNGSTDSVAKATALTAALNTFTEALEESLASTPIAGQGATTAFVVPSINLSSIASTKVLCGA